MDRAQRGSWILVFVGVLTTIVVISFARAAYGIELPYMREGLLISFKQAGFLGTANSLGYLSTILFAGVIASKWGSKNTILAGVALSRQDLPDLLLLHRTRVLSFLCFFWVWVPHLHTPT